MPTNYHNFGVFLYDLTDELSVSFYMIECGPVDKFGLTKSAGGRVYLKLRELIFYFIIDKNNEILCQNRQNNLNHIQWKKLRVRLQKCKKKLNQEKWKIITKQKKL